MYARPPGRQDLCTPPHVIRDVQAAFGLIVCDVAASESNSVCADMFFTAENSALDAPCWAKHGLNWCNPPFKMFGKFTRAAHAMAAKGCETLVLATASIATNWWQENVHGKAGIYPIKRFAFVGQPAPFPKDLVLLHYGPNVTPTYHPRLAIPCTK